MDRTKALANFLAHLLPKGGATPSEDFMVMLSAGLKELMQADEVMRVD